ncbi:MAG TPA: acyl-CoA thioesterase [Candidatus Thermoplasmatota archaeon]|nr:acyl-CoA thioesterase [Candidatus Thermoplasmatota archaeon]
MHPLPPRPMSESRANIVRLMMPPDANPHGNVHGGVIMKFVDEVAGIVAHRHARRNVVTARVDRMDFHEPVFVGNALTLNACLAYTGRTSMEVKVDIRAENLDTGEVVHTGTAWLTMIALNDRGRPAAVPPVAPQTEEEKALFEEGRARYEERRKERQKS